MKDKETIMNFINKMDMYINPISEETIVSFIHGYEIGIKNRILTTLLSDHIAKKYNISKPAMGFSYQIKVYAEKNKMNWTEGFEKIVKELFQNL